MTFVHEPNKPTADGICYADTNGIPIPVLTLLSQRGLVFMTEFKWGEWDFGGDIIAGSLQAAHDIAFARGLGEKVVGRYKNIQPQNDSDLWFGEYEDIEPDAYDARAAYEFVLPAGLSDEGEPERPGR